MTLRPRRIPRRASGRSGRGGYTLLEILVALAVAMTFLSALYASFIGMMKTMDENRARLEAQRNARAAIMTMFDEIKQISGVGSSFVPILIGFNNDLTYGDGIDNDQDGRIDEEIVDGRDNDGDFNSATDDVHTQMGSDPIYERYPFTTQFPYGVSYPDDKDDLGDWHVDEDCKFGNDTLLFRITPTTPIPDVLFRTIVYQIGTLDGQKYVLLRQARTEFTPASGKVPVVSTAPLAFGCLGLDFLYWNANGNPGYGVPRDQRPYWQLTWDSTNVANFQPPKLPLPASVYIRLSMYSSSKPIQGYVPGQPVDTMLMQTVVNIEQTIGDAAYPRPVI